MNVKRFTARTSRDALTLVRQAFGDDAVVLSTKPCPEGVEVLAMAPESVQQIEKLSASSIAQRTAAAQAQQAASQQVQRPPARAAQPPAAKPSPKPARNDVQEDVAKLSMSTLSFQDYVRERMLKRRQASIARQNGEPGFADSRQDFADSRQFADSQQFFDSRMEPEMSMPSALEQRLAAHGSAPQLHKAAPALAVVQPQTHVQPSALPRGPVAAHRTMPTLHEEVATAIHAQSQPVLQQAVVPSLADNSNAMHAATARRDQQDMMNELRSMKGLIEDRFGALAFMEKMQRHPAQALLIQKMLDCGYSPALTRKLCESMPGNVSDETEWAASVLERNLVTSEAEAPLEDQGGVYALIGATGVGKTTTAAKLAAVFAHKHGATNLGLITLDAYRMGAHEQLRAYGRILGVPVHTAHDRASLEDLLELLASKKMVLIDTAGMAQRDTRTRELMEMLSHRSIQKLLVVNAASQGETIEDVMISYRAPACRGIVLSKMDEAVKLAPALDPIIRHRLKIVGVANGQRVPEDWHRLSAHALIHRSLRASVNPAYRVEASDVNLIFTAQQHAQRARPSMNA